MKKNNKVLLYVGIFVISILAYLCILLIDDAYPFGKKSFLTYDAYTQYKNMLQTLIEWLHRGDKSAILWNKGLGVGLYQDMLYYCMSPFNIIAVILGEKHMELSLVLIIIIKASCISVSALYFFEHTNKRNGELKNKWTTLIAVTCSLSYSFCGYVLAYGHNIIWLDGLMILPLIAIGIERLVDKADYRLYLFWLVVAVIVNFYYAIYICMFAVIYFLLENRNSFKEFIKNGLLFAGISVLAVIIAGVVLLPAINGILNAASSADGLNQAGLDQWGAVGEYISSFYPLKQITCNYLFNHNSFCGSVVVLLTMLYMVSKVSAAKQKLKYGIAVVFLVLGLNWLKLNYVLHGLTVTHGMGNRFAIILTFILLVMGYTVLVNLDKVAIKDVLIAFGMTGILYVISLLDNENMIVPWAYIIFIIITIFCAILFVLYVRKSIKCGTVVLLLTVLWLCELYMNFFYIMPDKTNDVCLTDEIQLSDWEAIYDNLAVSDGERKTALINKNYAPKTEVNWYSSMINGNAVCAFRSMGMGHFDNVECVYNGTTPLTALMYNVRYVLTNETGTLGGYHDIYEDDTYRLYEADVLPGMGFVLDKEIETWTGTQSAAENQNDFIKLGCGINDKLFDEVDLSDAEESYNCLEMLEREKGYYLYKSTTAFSPNIHIEFDADRDMELYLFSSDTRDQYVTVTVDAEEVVSSKYSATEFASDIGKVKKGQHIKIMLFGGASFGECGEKRIKLYTFNQEAFEQAREKITSETMTFVRYQGNTFTGKIASKEGGVLYLAFPYNDGFTIKIDGKVTNKLKLGDGFMGVEIDAGEHEVTIEYHTPGLFVGLCVSLFGLVILVVVTVIKNKRLRKNLYI